MGEDSIVPSITIKITDRVIGIAVIIIPKKRQFFAFLGSSYRIANHEIIPPTIPPKIGKINQKLLRVRIAVLSKEDMCIFHCNLLLKNLLLLITNKIIQIQFKKKIDIDKTACYLIVFLKLFTIHQIENI